MRILSGIIIALLSPLLQVYAADFPFVDVPVGSQNYIAIKSLFDNKVIFDDGSHKFRPDDLLRQDEFIGWSLSASCDSCLNPSIEDLAKFQSSPFPDIGKSNPNYYCIARALDTKTITGVPLDQNGKSICQNGQSYTQAAFCGENTVSRIEAVSLLLREANLWNDALNNKYQKNLTITDVTEYWYGYAQKAVEVGLLGLSQDGKVSPDVAITRGEFANMSAKIVDYNQCLPINFQNKIWSRIGAVESDGTPLQQGLFSKDTSFSLEGLTSNVENYTFSWKAIDASNGKTVTQNGPSLVSSKLGVGSWYISLTIKDKDTQEIVSTSNVTITISPETVADLGKNITAPTIFLAADTNNPGAGSNVALDANSTGKEPLKYVWDFGDGNTATSLTDSSINALGGGKMNHTYAFPGSYTLSVQMTDADGKSSLSKTTIVVSGKIDSDGDTVEDDLDLCPEVKGDATNDGCPKISTNIYTLGAFLPANSSQSNSINFSDNASALNNSLNASITDTDSDGITDDIDACPTIPGGAANGGCPIVGSFLGSIEENSCAMSEIQKTGGIIIEPVCDVCPCPTSISLGNKLRRCDIIFPAILSKDFTEIFSRGALFQIP